MTTNEAASPIRVLVAEDESIIRMDLAEMLTEHGYDVIAQVANGQEAIEMTQQLRPDVVVMDVKMPVLDGISAAESINSQRLAAVVLLTAYSQPDLIERAQDAGVMAYVVKPFEGPTDVLPAIQIALSRYAEIVLLEQENSTLEERLETRKKIEQAKSILQTDLGLTEPEAFRWIQKTAMDLRKSMREVAEGVIDHSKGENV